MSSLLKKLKIRIQNIVVVVTNVKASLKNHISEIPANMESDLFKPNNLKG